MTQLILIVSPKNVMKLKYYSLYYVSKYFVKPSSLHQTFNKEKTESIDTFSQKKYLLKPNVVKILIIFIKIFEAG